MHENEEGDFQLWQKVLFINYVLIHTKELWNQVKEISFLDQVKRQWWK